MMEYSGELFRDMFEQFLDGSVVFDEGGGYFQIMWWDVIDGGFDVVGDLFNEVVVVFVLDI